MERLSLSEQVYRHVLEAIHRKELQPGDTLDRRRLATKLGTSVSPVQQALGRLEHEGFLEVLPRHGTRLRTVRLDDFRGTLLVRNALECQAARIYCGERVRGQMDHLRELAQQVDGTRAGARINWAAEVSFHRALVALVDCPAFLAEYDRVMRVGLFVLVNTFTIQVPFPPDPSGCWHGELVERLATAGPAEAERVLREHLEIGRETFLSIPSP
jgi:DNA-binding GntR family transcriptional regulator